MQSVTRSEESGVGDETGRDTRREGTKEVSFEMVVASVPSSLLRCAVAGVVGKTGW